MALKIKRYDLEFLGERGGQFADGVSFQRMRHLDLARFSSGSADGDRSRQSTAVEDALRKNMNTKGGDPGMSDETWDGDDSDGGGGRGGGGRRSGEEPAPSRAERQRRQRQHESSDGGDGGNESSRKRSGKL